MLLFFKKCLSQIAVLVALFLITACGGGGGGGGGVVPITVSGTVVDNSNTAVSGANIILNHDSVSLVTTGADGAFSFGNVTPPYTLTMKSGTTVIEYRNLSRVNPKLCPSTGGTTYSATLAGNVTGPPYPLAADQVILLGATNSVLTGGLANAATGDYSATFVWTGGTAITADLAALRISYTSPLITSFIQTGTRAGVSLNKGVNQTGLDIALSTAVTTASTILNYNAGAYSVGVGAKYLLLMANGAQFYFSSNAVIPSGSSIVLPSGGANFLIIGTDTNGNQAIKIGTAVLGGTTILDLPASTVLKNSLPANGATNVSKTPSLSWTPVSGADMYLVIISGPGHSYGFYLPSSSSSLTIPDYTTFGLPLAASTTYSWGVAAFKSSGLSPDSVTDPASSGLSMLNLYALPNLDYYTSKTSSFTTAP
jgi:hypothetical protein